MPVALADLDAAGVDYTVRRYLDDPPTRAELEGVLAALGLEPWDIAGEGGRRGGADFPRDADHRASGSTARRPPARPPAADHHPPTAPP